MDNLTHTLLGIALAQAGFSRRYGKGTTALMAIASNLPDLDALVLFYPGWDAILYRRMLTHSIVGLPMLAAAAAWVFRLFFKQMSWPAAFGLCLLAMLVHVFFDLINSFGVVLFYPFDLTRHELAWLFIIDLILWGLLLVPFILLRVKKWQPNASFFWRVSLTGVFIYIILCGLGRRQALTQLKNVAKESQIQAAWIYVFPEAFGPWHFRGVIKEGSQIKFYLLHNLIQKAELKEIYVTQEHDPEVQNMRLSFEARRLEWFFKAPVWQRDENGVIKVFDLRFRSLLLQSRGQPFVFYLKKDREIVSVTQG